MMLYGFAWVSSTWWVLGCDGREGDEGDGGDEGDDGDDDYVYCCLFLINDYDDF